MSKLSVFAGMALLTLASFASAEEGYVYSDWAKVTRVTPQYERVNKPRKECSYETVTYEREAEYRREPRQRSYGGAVIGGIAGGILGNQVGKGSGRHAATAAGAILGAIVGDRVDNRDGGGSPYSQARYEPEEREIKRCRTVDNWENELTGYQVEYDYDGHRFSRFMTEDPGRKVKVKVSVDPV